MNMLNYVGVNILTTILLMFIDTIKYGWLINGQVTY